MKNTLERAERGRKAKFISIVDSNWLVCLIKCKTTSSPNNSQKLWVCLCVCAQKPTPPSSHCSWRKCELKPINNPNHHYHGVISISICVSLCLRDHKSHLAWRPLRSRPTDRCATKKMAPLVFHSAFYLAPSISLHICRARHIDGGIQWATLIITEEDERVVNNSTEARAKRGRVGGRREKKMSIDEFEAGLKGV